MSSSILSAANSELNRQRYYAAAPKNLSDPPPTADAELTKQIHLQAPIGQALDDALQEFMSMIDEEECDAEEKRRKKKEAEEKREERTESEQQKQNNEDDTRLGLDPESLLEIRKAYAQACLWQETLTTPTSLNSSKRRRGGAKYHVRHPPPAAVVRGRLHHYNRMGGQWRIVADDVIIQPRQQQQQRGMNTNHEKRQSKHSSLRFKNGVGSRLINLMVDDLKDGSDGDDDDNLSQHQLQILAFDDV